MRLFPSGLSVAGIALWWMGANAPFLAQNPPAEEEPSPAQGMMERLERRLAAVGE